MKNISLSIGIILIALVTNVSANQSSNKAVHQVIEKRTKEVCSTILASWFFISHYQENNKILRRNIVDCYLGYARLSMLDNGKVYTFNNASLTELPSVILSQEYGFDLNIYRPLSGKKLIINGDTN